jgi:hypothetical protein
MVPSRHARATWTNKATATNAPTTRPIGCILTHAYQLPLKGWHATRSTLLCLSRWLLPVFRAGQ